VVSEARFAGEARRPPVRGGWRPGLDDLYIVAAVAVILIPTLAMAVTPNDFWFHLAMGRETWESGRVPTQDPFSFTRAGAAYYNQAWLAQLALYGLHRLGGLELVVFVHALVITASVVLLIALCRELGGSKRATSVVVCLITLPMAAPNFGVRPQAFAFLLFALVLWLVWGARHRATVDPAASARLWAVPPAVAVWANLHGSFPLAIAILVAAIAGDTAARRLGCSAPAAAFDGKLVLVAAASVLASLLNPVGWKVWAYVLELSTSPVIAEFVMEWQRPSLGDAMGIAFYLALALVVAGVALARRRLDPAEVLLAAGLLVLALSALRNTGWLGFAAAALLARLGAGRLPDRPPGQAGSPRLNGALAALLALGAVVSLPWIRMHTDSPIAALYGAHTPVAAARALDALDDPPGRLFHEVGYGSYLAWARRDAKVFIDPRFELYPRSMWRDYMLMSSGLEVERIVEEYAIDGVLADKQLQGELVAALRADASWRLVYEDHEAVAFLPRAALPSAGGGQ
jgi:hypothetical protein